MGESLVIEEPDGSAKSIQAGRLRTLEIRGSDIIPGTPLVTNRANPDQLDF